jgi:hypothetical protein
VPRVPAGWGCRDGQGRVELIWRPTARIDARAGVPLAGLTPKGPLELDSARPKARALARPQVGTGATPPDGTPWRPFLHPLFAPSFAGV